MFASMDGVAILPASGLISAATWFPRRCQRNTFHRGIVDGFGGSEQATAIPRSGSERIVPERGHDDVVARRRGSAEPRECHAFDVLVLGAGGDAAIIALVDVLPEAHRQFRHTPVIPDAVRRRGPAE